MGLNFRKTSSLFSKDEGGISSKEEESYWSCKGTAFKAQNPDVDDILYATSNHKLQTTGAGIRLFAPISLPHGAVITAAIVYSASTTEDWYLTETNLSSSATATNATASLGTEDKSISNATIDNSTKAYGFVIDPMDAGDVIDGARITYTI